MTNEEIRTNVFNQIDAIIENSNCIYFKILGWKYLNIRLILCFSDCKQVFDWEYQSTEFTSFFTKNYVNGEMNIDMTEFSKDIELEKAE